jgi:hypothetical protein
MELLKAECAAAEPGERCVRHGRAGQIVILLVLAAPLAALVARHELVLGGLGNVTWVGWLGLAPLLAVCVPVYAVILVAAIQITRRAFSPANWLMRLSPAGLTLNLRSFQNAHFPAPEHVVVRLSWREVACVREARDVTPVRDPDQSARRERWLQIELAGVDTGPIAAAVKAERERRGPETKRFGITSRTRFGHVPVFVATPGILRTDWMGKSLLPEFERYTRVEELHVFNLNDTPDLAARLAELVRRGDELAAVQLARQELGLTLGEAREHVRSLQDAA